MKRAAGAKTIPQRDLRNRSGEILRKAERGQEFVISVDGRPVAVLGPYRKSQWVPKAEYLRVLRPGPEDVTFFDDIADMGSTGTDIDARWTR